MAEQVKLLGMCVSPYSRRVELALKLKGVDYKYVEEDLFNKSQLLLECNPVHKKVPVLVHNGKPVAESIVILDYIDETWKHDPILPKDPYERTRARFWSKIIDGKMLELALKIIKEKPEREEARKDFQEYMKLLESELQGKNFFGGQTFGFLDIVATTVPFWLIRVIEAVGVDPISRDECPEIHKWIERVSKVDAVRECIPPREKYEDHIRRQYLRQRPAREKPKL